jgi:YVTN family beta-propeller protein
MPSIHHLLRGDLEGATIGPYCLEGLLGRGGMSVVYRARQPGLGRAVAVKVLLPHLIHDEEFLVRFRHEAKIAGQLTHPNILPVYEFGEDEQVPYIVMEFIEGGTLEARLKHEVPIEWGLNVLRQIMAATRAAHSCNPPVVHRDIKPNNILMRADWPLLADFGIAKILEPSKQATPATIAGTAEYMAPEQSTGGQVDQRADIYALGVLLFQLLVGRLPYLGASPNAVIEQHRFSPIPLPSQVKTGLSPAWDSIVVRCLAKNAAERFPSVVALDAAIADVWQDVQRAERERAEQTLWQVHDLDAQQVYERAVDALAARDWGRAIADSARLLERDPGHTGALQVMVEAQQGHLRELQEREARELLRQATDAIALEQFVVAGRCIRQALGLCPELEAVHEAEAGLKRAQALSALYHEARVAIAHEHWETAWERLTSLVGKAPDYRDVETLLAEVKAQWVVGSYAEGVAAEARHEWFEAVAAFQQVIRLDASYRDAESRLAKAQERLADSVSSPDFQPDPRKRRFWEWFTGISARAGARHLLPLSLAVLGLAVLGVLGVQRAGGLAGIQMGGPSPTPVPSAALLRSRTYIVTGAANAVVRVDPAAPTVVTTIPVGARPNMAAVGPGGHYLYVANHDDDNLSIIDTTSDSVVGTVTVNPGPYGIVADAVRRRLYVGSDGGQGQVPPSISIVDTSTDTMIGSIPLDTKITDIAISPDGSRLYLTVPEDNKLLAIDTLTLSVLSLQPGRGPGTGPVGVAVAPDGKRVYVTIWGDNALAIVDLPDHTISKTVRVGNGPRGIAVAPDGGRVYVGNTQDRTVSIVDPTGPALVRNVDMRSDIWSVAVSPDSSKVYASTRETKSLSILDVATNTVTAVEVGDNPLGIAIKP